MTASTTPFFEVGETTFKVGDWYWLGSMPVKIIGPSNDETKVVIEFVIDQTERHIQPIKIRRMSLEEHQRAATALALAKSERATGPRFGLPQPTRMTREQEIRSRAIQSTVGLYKASSSQAEPAGFWPNVTAIAEYIEKGEVPS